MKPLLLALILATAASAQTSVLSLSPLGLAYDLGETDRGTMLGFVMDFQQSIGRRSLIVQGGLSGSMPVFDGPSMTAAHVAAGQATMSGSRLFSVAAGPSFGRAQVNRTRGVAFVGLYVSGRAGIAVSEGVGVGVEAFLNANTVMPVAGGRFVLHIGRFPGRRGDPPPPRVPMPLPGTPRPF